LLKTGSEELAAGFDPEATGLTLGMTGRRECCKFVKADVSAALGFPARRCQQVCGETSGSRPRADARPDLAAAEREFVGGGPPLESRKMSTNVIMSLATDG
jgi:hypothetical protein